jgi:DNA polymerase-3 subunit gamma/tau
VVSQVAKQEGVAADPDAAELIALLAEGSYRDALSILQKVLIANPGTKLSLEEVEQATGAPRRALVHALLAALASGERGAALVAVEKANRSGADMRLYLELAIEAVRATLLLRYAPDLKTDLSAELGEDECKALEVFTKGEGITHKTLLALINALDRSRYAPMPSIALELAIMELYP